ncbi:MAG: hypothetical protein H7Z41_02170 [Cytophagales bacterium]|nr:hypothetical protein [Armatimonadota bacterium]
MTQDLLTQYGLVIEIAVLLVVLAVGAAVSSYSRQRRRSRRRKAFYEKLRQGETEKIEEGFRDKRKITAASESAPPD